MNLAFFNGAVYGMADKKKLMKKGSK